MMNRMPAKMPFRLPLEASVSTPSRRNSMCCTCSSVPFIMRLLRLRHSYVGRRPSTFHHCQIAQFALARCWVEWDKTLFHLRIPSPGISSHHRVRINGTGAFNGPILHAPGDQFVRCLTFLYPVFQ